MLEPSLLGIAELRRGSGGRSPAIGKNDDEERDDEDCRGGKPKQEGLGFEAGVQKDELAIAGDDEIFDLLIGVAGLQPFPHEHAEVFRERRGRIVDRLILTNEAAQTFGDVPRSRLERRILQHLIGLNCFHWGHSQADQNGKERAEPHTAETRTPCM